MIGGVGSAAEKVALMFKGGTFRGAPISPIAPSMVEAAAMAVEAMSGAAALKLPLKNVAVLLDNGQVAALAAMASFGIETWRAMREEAAREKAEGGAS